MKLSHLRYIIEVAKTGSITRAAQNLYMGQPNLSKAIKDMETDLGFTVFTRSSKGAVPTKKGAELIRRAEELLDKADCFEEDYFGTRIKSERVSVAVCGAEECFLRIERAAVGSLKDREGFKLEYFRCNKERAIELAESGEASFAAVRDYSTVSEFEARISQSGLKGQILFSGKRQILTAKTNKAAQKEIIGKADLAGYTEIFIYGTDADTKSEQGNTAAVSDFESACRVLAGVKDSFMVVSEADGKLVSGELCTRACGEGGSVTDWVIYKEGKRFSEAEEEFLGKITKAV